VTTQLQLRHGQAWILVDSCVELKLQDNTSQWFAADMANKLLHSGCRAGVLARVNVHLLR